MSDRLIIESLRNRLRRRGVDAGTIDVVAEELTATLEEQRSAATGLSDEVSIDPHIGDYELLDVLGRGGGGVVYAATHVPTGDSVALKIVPVSDSTARFRREMDLVLQLAHPHIVTAREVGEHHGIDLGQSWYYIALERLCGPDMRARVRDHGPMTPAETLPIIRGAASALHHAHLRGLIHRDVKPANLMMALDGRIKLMDLGLATDAGSPMNADRSFHTRHEAVGGTPGYMAPEQAASLADADPRSDIYSLGATWFYMLTGSAMVGGSTWSKRLNHLIEGTEIQTLAAEHLPEPMLSVWRRMVDRDPEARPQTMLEVIEALPKSIDEISGPTDAIDVLVVEDNRDDLYLTIESLKRFNHGVRVESATTLAGAIESAARVTPDVVLLDLQLPDSDGIDTVAAFCDAVPGVSLIVLSGNRDDDVAAACIRLGAMDFVLKHSLSVHELERLIFVTLSRSIGVPPSAK